jgi:SAM-dependent methyltransferase
LECQICNNDKFSVVYLGPIRGFDENDPQEIVECKKCHTQTLKSNDKQDYESAGYRDEVGRDDFARHFPNIALLVNPQMSLSGKTVLDVGSSSGTYMKGIESFCNRVIGVEPNQEQRDELEGRFTMHKDLDSAIDDHCGTIDTVTCWHVIEHVENPVEFVQKLGSLLSDDGRIYLSTPNRNEILMRLLDTDYADFFYRKWHKYYFDQDSLEYTVYKSGLKVVTTHFGHSFGIGNMMGWLKEKMPVGNGIVLHPEQDQHIDMIWKQWMEIIKASDTLYTVISKERLQ